MKLDPLQIVKSKTRAAILGLFFNGSGKEYYLRQIEKLTKYSAGNIRREMLKLEESGLFVSRVFGKMKLYKLNTNYPLYNEIKNIVGKTIGIEGGLKAIVQRHKEIDFAFIYGSFAKGEEKGLSDIDIIIIGNIKPKEIKSDLFEYQSKIGREINSTVYSTAEFLNKLKKENHFISSIIKAPKIFIKGRPDDFRRFIQVRKTAKA